MRFKITYVKDAETRKAVIEAKTLNEALKTGYRQYRWESILEINTEDDRTIQGKV